MKNEDFLISFAAIKNYHSNNKRLKHLLSSCIKSCQENIFYIALYNSNFKYKKSLKEEIKHNDQFEGTTIGTFQELSKNFLLSKYMG